MPFFTSSKKKHFSVHKLMATSTMLSPTHHSHLRPLVSAGGGETHSKAPKRQLYLSDTILAHLRRVFDELRKSDAELSKEKFAKFLREEQETLIELKLETFKFEQFLETLYYNHGLEAIRAVDPATKDLTKPISNYYISSSHNTYLSGNQLISKSTTDAYKNVLTRGCRCIEIDVHNGDPSEVQSPPISKTPNTPISPTSPTRPEHRKHNSITGSTFSSKAASLLESFDEKLTITKSKFGSVKDKERGQTVKDKTQDRVPTIHEGEDTKKTTNSLEPTTSLERPASLRSTRSGEPLVLHGWTLTAPVGFRAVCKSIRESAFVSSQLPIIASLEVHADLEQQEVMVQIMKEEWAGLLVDAAHPECNPDERLPRLEELKGKILIKVKKAIADTQVPTLTPAPTKSEETSGSEDEKPAPKKKVKICESLGKLGIYTHSEHFSSFSAPSAKTPPHVYSIGENDIIDLHKKQKSEMMAHNRDFFMRAYPSGLRIDSSNLDPSVFWRKGIQMVALNWQELDEGMMLNEGMFAGEHGWVLKPPGYRSDPAEPIEWKTLDFKITVFAAQHIPMEEGQTEKGFHPYVKCEIHVETGEESLDGGKQKEGEYKAKTSYGTTDHPDFGASGQTLAFPTIEKVVEELTFIRIKVEDSKTLQDDLAAWACIRLDRLQNGYRFIPLMDENGVATPGILLVKVEKRLR